LTDALLFPVALLFAVLLILSMIIDGVIYLVRGRAHMVCMGWCMKKIDNWFESNSEKEDET
jgi:hypothetical protein